MAFKGAHFAYMSAKNTFSPLPMKIALAGVLLIPVIFAGFYLSAFLDPYAHLENIPVAVVNEDKGATINGEQRNIGGDVVQNLKDSEEKLGWSFVTAEEAEEGMERGLYYMSCTIPEDFSQQIASADTNDPEHANITITYNQSENMLASQIGQTAWTRAAKQVNEAVAEEYFGTIFETIDEGGEQLQTAVDGALELQDGLTTAQDGSNTITVNLNKLVAGSTELQAGIAQLQDGANQVSAGTQELADKASVLPDATQQLADGGQAALAGASTLKTATSQLENGAGNALVAAQSAQAGAEKLYGGLTSLKSGITKAKNGASDLQSGIGQLSGELGDISSSMGGLAGSMKTAGKAMEEGGEALADGAEAISTVSTPLSSASASLSGAEGDMANAESDLANASSSTQGAVSQAQSAADTIGGIGGDLDNASAALSRALAIGELPNEAAAEIQNALSSVNTANGSVSGAAASAQGAADSMSGANSSIQTASTSVSSAGTQIASAESEMSAASAAAGSAAQSAAGNASALQSAADEFPSASSTISKAVTPESIAKLNGSISELQTGARELAKGLAWAEGALGSYDDKNTLIGGANALQTGLGNLAGEDGLTALAGGAKQVNLGVGALVGSASEGTGLNALAGGLSSMNESAGTLIAGVDQLNSGAGLLASSFPAASDGAGQITSGASQLADGSATLTSGLGSAVSGSGQLASGLDEASAQMDYSPQQITAKKSMMSKPVQMSEDYYTTVKNYGTGFAPLFIGLGIWVGAIFNCFLFRSLNIRLCLSGVNPIIVAAAGFIPMAAFSMLSTTVALAFVQFALKAQIGNVAGYYAMGILASLCFTAIIQFLVAAAGFPGRFIAVVLLTLQLTSSSGTFPVLVEPDFFGAISPFFPMTYIVEGMRQLMTGVGYGVALQDALVIAGFAIVFFLLTALVAKRKQMVNITDIHPLLDL